MLSSPDEVYLRLFSTTFYPPSKSNLTQTKSSNVTEPTIPSTLSTPLESEKF